MRPVQLALLVLLSVLWGAAYLFMRSSVPAFGAAPMVFMRLALASVLVLLPLALWQHGPRPLLDNWRQLMLFGLLFTALPFLGLGYSARHISAGLLAVLQSAAPLFSAIVAHFWLRERISRRAGLGLLIGFAGVALLVWDKVGARDNAALAIWVALLVTAGWGVSSNYARTRMSHIDPTVMAAGTIGVAAVCLAPFAVFSWPAVTPGPRAWAEVVFLGLASSGLAFLIYFKLLRSIGAVRATSVSFLSPIVSMGSAAVYLGEPVTLQMVIGCAVIVSGTALTLGLVPAKLRIA